MRNAAAASALAALLAACQQSSPGAADATGFEPLQKLRVAFSSQPQCALISLALAKGYFTDEGLAIEQSEQAYGKLALQELIAHRVDIAAAAETPIVFAVLKGEAISVLANIDASTTNNAVVARRSGGIATAADLRGKRIGYTPGTTSDFFLDSLLTANGLRRGQVQPVPMVPEDMEAAIVAGRVDAVSTWNYPLTRIAHRLGSAGIVLYDREIYTETYNLVARQEFVAERPRTIERFLRALVRAEKSAAADPQEAQAVMAAAAKVDAQLIRDLWPSFSHRVVLDQTLIITLEDETRWAMSKGLTAQRAMPDYRRHIHQAGLRAVEPQAVRLNR